MVAVLCPRHIDTSCMDGQKRREEVESTRVYVLSGIFLYCPVRSFIIIIVWTEKSGRRSWRKHPDEVLTSIFIQFLYGRLGEKNAVGFIGAYVLSGRFIIVVMLAGIANQFCSGIQNLYTDG